jgi:hypothetical protein
VGLGTPDGQCQWSPCGSQVAVVAGASVLVWIVKKVPLAVGDGSQRPLTNISVLCVGEGEGKLAVITTRTADRPSGDGGRVGIVAPEETVEQLVMVEMEETTRYPALLSAFES